MNLNYFCRIFVGWSALLLAMSASASTVLPIIGQNIQVVAGQDSTDTLILNAPNVNGVSVNEFERFSVDRPLRLLNLWAAGAGTISAKKIVLVTEDFYLNDLIEVVGSAADVIVLAKNGTPTINCSGCEFKNIYRLSLVTGDTESGFSHSSSEFEKVLTTKAKTTNVSGRTSIATLSAPGLLALDVITDELNLSGHLSLHQNATYDSFGGFTASTNGNKKVGSGSVNIVLGASEWHYPQQKILQFLQAPQGGYGSAVTLNGRISAVGVKISTAVPATVNTSIDTRTDLITTVHYNGYVHFSEEQVDIQQFSESPLGIYGQIDTEGDVNLRSSGAILTGSTSHVTTPSTVSMISGGTASQNGNIQAKQVDIAALLIANEGEIQADESIDLWAEFDVVNQYGGLIQATVVNIQSVAGVVRNGSRTPYRSVQNGFLFSENEGATVDNIETYFDATRLGVFYNPNNTVEVADQNNYVMAKRNNATIFGVDVSIYGKGFENINPYYVKVVGNNINVDPDIASQIKISAERELVIDAYNYIVNSSAFLVVNQPAGGMFLKSRNISNERYRMFSVLNYINDINTTLPLGQNCFTDCTIDDENKTIQTALVSYSPPGVMLSLGRGEFSAESSFVNNTGYFEIYKSASFNTPLLNSIGLDKGVITRHTLAIDSPVSRSDVKCWDVNNSEYFLYVAFFCDQGNTEVKLSDYSWSKDIDTLFYVHGAATALNTEMEVFRNHRPLDSYIASAIQSYAEEAAREAAPLPLGEFKSITYENVVSNGDSYSMTVVETRVADTLGGKVDYQIKSTAEFSLLDELIKLYEKLKQTIVDFFNEIDWWNEE